MKKHAIHKPNRKASAADLAVAEQAYQEAMLGEFETFFGNCIDQGEDKAAEECAKGLAIFRSARTKLLTLL
jgi:hypothetical protein